MPFREIRIFLCGHNYTDIRIQIFLYGCFYTDNFYAEPEGSGLLPAGMSVYQNVRYPSRAR